MDRYSRLVAWLKVLLPLTALGLLSTLFLLSRNIDPAASIPFAETEIKDRLRDEQVTAPFFAGTTSGGDLVSVSAGTMRMGEGQGNRADDLSAQIDLASGTRVVLFSDMGSFDLIDAQSTLEGNVVITTSTGYKVATEALIANFDTLTIESPGQVTANSPIGTLQAGKMLLKRPPGSENVQLIFTNGVKLLYDPEKLEE
jgi:lipopolysaccharide export system protein LptC